MFYIIIFLSIVIPLLSNNKKVGLRISFLLLFIIWGLQYEMVNDWPMNLSRWNSVNHQETIYRDVEPLLAYLMSLAKPLTFFGWLMVCAVFELGTIYYFTRKFVIPKYYWLVIFVLMLRIDYGLLLINSNRQTISVILSMYAVLVLLKSEKYKFLRIKDISILGLILAVLILYACTQIHTAAIMSFIIIPIYLFVKLVESPNIKILLIICNILFISKFFIDMTFLEPYLLNYLNDSNIEGFDEYLALLNISDNTYSIVEQPLICAIINISLLYYDKMDLSYKYFSLLYVVGIIIDGYMSGNLSRSTQYLHIYIIFLIPILICYLNKVRGINFRVARKILYIVIVCYIIYSFQKYVNTEYYNNWNNFKTVFEAPKWL